ncbi:hypothetical protein PFISCL1PPCAC_19350 [Pristionchus fissidentatus]|uniref:Translocon-associated protein subunit beta n=1 Tax=Pristionchus fissidentatus TaxID=1538716 RepID=A0AAV5W943_9BILA|nr:hypothetical protein PFISCL1PPCAC_19350 [Pristionchus fissidentatus]
MTRLVVFLSLLSLVAHAAIDNRPNLLISKQFLSNYLPINHEIPLVLSAVNTGSKPALDVTLFVHRQLFTNASSTKPFTVRGPLSVKFAKIMPGETVQHVVRVILTSLPKIGEDQSFNDAGFNSIAVAPVRVIYHSQGGERFAGSYVVTKEKVPQVILESAAQKATGSNLWYWMVFGGMMSVVFVIPLANILPYKWKYDDDKKQRKTKVNGDEDEPSTEKEKSKTKSASQQFYAAKRVDKKKPRKE